MLGAATDGLHALMMAAWALCIPVLFVHRWPRLRVVYAVYAIAFVVVSQVSQWILDECFFTTIARAFWTRAAAAGGGEAVSGEWFTVRLAYAVFHLAPSHRAITLVSEALIVVTAIGVVVTALRHRGAHATTVRTA